jgi:hypothetical protein
MMIIDLSCVLLIGIATDILKMFNNRKYNRHRAQKGADSSAASTDVESTSCWSSSSGASKTISAPAKKVATNKVPPATVATAADQQQEAAAVTKKRKINPTLSKKIMAPTMAPTEAYAEDGGDIIDANQSVLDKYYPLHKSSKKAGKIFHK